MGGRSLEVHKLEHSAFLALIALGRVDGFRTV
jgi:hypothetical protein